MFMKPIALTVLKNIYEHLLANLHKNVMLNVMQKNVFLRLRNNTNHFFPYYSNIKHFFPNFTKQTIKTCHSHILNESGTSKQQDNN